MIKRGDILLQASSIQKANRARYSVSASSGVADTLDGFRRVLTPSTLPFFPVHHLPNALFLRLLLSFRFLISRSLVVLSSLDVFNFSIIFPSLFYPSLGSATALIDIPLLLSSPSLSDPPPFSLPHSPLSHPL